MAESFELDLTIRPGQAQAAAKKVGDALERADVSATQLKQSIGKALNQRQTGVRTSLNTVNRQLNVTQRQALIADTSLRDLGKNVKPRGVKNLNRELKKTKGLASEVGTALKQAAAGFGVVLLARKYVELSDAFTLARNRIRLVTESADELDKVQSRLFRISEDTRTAYEATSTVYTRLAANQDELGVSTDRLLKFTRSLNQAVQLSGATAAESRNALIQFSQGIAAGALRGDELRSVLEQLPKVADVIAKKLNVTRGELRKMGEQGKITSSIILDAFEDASESLAEDFASTVPTVGQAFTTLGNALLKNIGFLNQATGASEKLSRSLIGLAKLIRITDTDEVALNRTVTEQVGAYRAVNKQIGALRNELVNVQSVIRETNGESEVAVARAEKLKKAIDSLTASQAKRREEEEKRKATAAIPKADATIEQRIAGLKEEQRLLGLSSQERKIQVAIGKEVTRFKKAEVDLSKEANKEALNTVKRLIRENVETEKQNKLKEKQQRDAERKASTDTLSGLKQEVEQLRIISSQKGLEREISLEIARQEKQIGELSDEKRKATVDLVTEKQRLLGLVEKEKQEEQAAAKAAKERTKAELERANRVAQLRDQVDVVGRLKAQEAELLELRRTERDLIPEIDAAVQELRIRQLEAANDLGSGFSAAFARLRQEANDLAAVGSSVVDVFATRGTEALNELRREGSTSFKKLASSILDDLAAILTRLLVVKALSAFAPGLSGGGAATAVSGLNSGAQFGATVQPGQAPRPVGENGPELFVPNRTGSIVPNAKDQGRSSRPVNLTSVVLVDMEQLVPEIIAGGGADDALITRVGANPERFAQVQQ